MAMFDIDHDQIRRLAELLQDTGLTEIELAEGEKRLRLTRATVTVAATMAPAAGQVPLAAPTTASPSASRHGGGGSVPAGAVTSPMVGTAYTAAEPGGKPFVQIGDSVKTGQTVLIIEAMKVMNPIKAPRAGTVTQILVKDAQPVEFGEVLMIVE